ncbi:hypothetical protein D3C75_1351850 [compost metagenome]
MAQVDLHIGAEGAEVGQAALVERRRALLEEHQVPRLQLALLLSEVVAQQGEVA